MQDWQGSFEEENRKQHCFGYWVCGQKKGSGVHNLFGFKDDALPFSVLTPSPHSLRPPPLRG